MILKSHVHNNICSIIAGRIIVRFLKNDHYRIKDGLSNKTFVVVQNAKFDFPVLLTQTILRYTPYFPNWNFETINNS